MRVQLVEISLVQAQPLLLQLQLAFFEKSMRLILLWVYVINLHGGLKPTLCGLLLPELGRLFLEPGRRLAEFFVGGRGRFIAVPLVVNVVRVRLLANMVVVVALYFVIIRVVQVLTCLRCRFQPFLLPQLP